MTKQDCDRICLALDHYLCNTLKDENEKEEYVRLLIEYDMFSEDLTNPVEKVKRVDANLIEVDFRNEE